MHRYIPPIEHSLIKKQKPKKVRDILLDSKNGTYEGDSETDDSAGSLDNQTIEPPKKRTKYHRIPYFDTEPRTQQNSKIEIEKLTQTWNFDLIRWNLKLAQVNIVEATEIINTTTKTDCIVKIIDKINIIPVPENYDEKTYRSLFTKDMAELSDIQYKLVIKLNSLYDNMSTFNKVLELRKHIDSLFNIQENKFEKGFYLKPLSKLTFVLRFFIKKFSIKENYKFDIKLAADGTKLNKKSTSLFNTTFTILNEKDKCRTSWGNYILGKILLEITSLI
jgi:hypothetical protein